MSHSRRHTAGHSVLLKTPSPFCDTLISVLASCFHSVGQVPTSFVYLLSGALRLFPPRYVCSLALPVPTGSAVTLMSVIPKSRSSAWAFLPHPRRAYLPRLLDAATRCFSTHPRGARRLPTVSLLFQGFFHQVPASPPAFLPHPHVQPLVTSAQFCLLDMCQTPPLLRSPLSPRWPGHPPPITPVHPGGSPVLLQSTLRPGAWLQGLEMDT